MNARLTLLVLGVLGGPPVLAEPTEQDPGRRLVEDFISDIATLAGRFEQSLIDAKGEVIEVTSGTLEIQRPGRFRWSYVEPYEQVLVADGLNIWSYDVDLAQVTVKPQAEALSNTPALLLGGSADALEQFVHENTYSSESTTWVRMSPKNTDSGFLHVELGFIDRQLSRMVFYDNLEQTTVVALNDVLLNEHIDPGRFEFSAPDGVDVVGSPAVAQAPIP
ncbi:MAG: outer membrane lipoprotein chaperone LolA [Gammaproteobacteria bacterium]|nr:outer membrane lipoprotein chaperone LolA [Gammaproteobacteria bacterium]